MTLIAWQISSLILIILLGLSLYLLWRFKVRLVICRSHEEKSYQELLSFPDLNPNPVMQFNKMGVLIYANPASDPLLANWKMTLNEKIPATWREIIRQVLISEKRQNIEIVSGKQYFSLDIVPMKAGYVVIYGLEITERKKVENELEQHTTQDPATKLPNRVIFIQNLGLEINRAKVLKTKFGILILRLDDYQEIANSYGKIVGDDFIRLFCERLMDCISSETVARLSYIEFGIIAPSLHEPSTMAEFTQDLIKKCKLSYKVNEHNILTALSAGIAFYPTDGTLPDELIRNAQLALNRTGAMKNQYEFFQRGMIEQLQVKRNILSDLHHALEEGQFQLHYQPQIELKTNKMISAEALIRWEHPQKGSISPLFFMGAAEETHLISEIGEWAIREACQQMVRWKKEGHQPIEVAVNVSAHQLFQTNFVEMVKGILQETQVDPSFLELELTESVLVQDITRAIEVMKGLNELGIGLALDDFGTGYSSLSYLMQFPVNKLKIDRSFVKVIEDDESQRYAITKGIIDLGHSLGLRIVAEGVETKIQLQYMKEHNCDLVQGYYYSQAQPPEKFAQLFKQEWDKS